MGSLSVSGGNSTKEAGFSTDFSLGVMLRPVALASGELSLFTRGLREGAFFVGAATVLDLETARVVRAGAGGSVEAFVRVEARVAFGLLAIRRVCRG